MPLTKKPFKYFTVNSGTYDYDIDICISEDRFRVLKLVNKRFNLPKSEGWIFTEEDLEARGKFFSDTKHKRIPIIWMPRVPKTYTEYATLSHEILHAVSHIFRFFNIRLSESSEEAYCHFMSYLLREILKRLK